MNRYSLITFFALFLSVDLVKASQRDELMDITIPLTKEILTTAAQAVADRLGVGKLAGFRTDMNIQGELERIRTQQCGNQKIYVYKQGEKVFYATREAEPEKPFLAWTMISWKYQEHGSVFAQALGAVGGKEESVEISIVEKSQGDQSE